MTNTEQKVNDLPEAEKNEIIKKYQDLKLTGNVVLMTVKEAKKAIQEAEANAQSSNNNNPTVQAPAATAANSKASDKTKQTNKTKQADKTKTTKTTDKTEKVEQPKVGEKQPKCCICLKPVIKNKCTGCGTRY